MKQVGVADLKNNLSRHLREVRSGATIEVTDHDTPVARLVPAGSLSRLVIRRASRPWSEVAHKRYKPVRLPIGSTELIRQDRDIR
jgi:prevent-host-death family protein